MQALQLTKLFALFCLLAQIQVVYRHLTMSFATSRLYLDILLFHLQKTEYLKPPVRLFRLLKAANIHRCHTLRPALLHVYRLSRRSRKRRRRILDSAWRPK
jgi:hypothetical protein